ncbi:PREDICTED: polyadenylation and cleavage factor homolog 1-like [Tarenaya hassleriana]|uniref:polyadenylation and cleavage factor homolog 1-like n=1 Tax=Tarenaya hassleriana TaxID=28532 RepID=UPI00053C6640|nr:PREDICTED: polyadenylation and cleavage factor homolog 1-like [Tarenaya hassleriana]
MSSNMFFANTRPQRSGNADLKRRWDDRSRVGGFQGYPHQKRARAQTPSQFPSANPNNLPLYHRSSIPRVSGSYGSQVFPMSGSYVRGLGSSNVSNNVVPNRFSPALPNNDTSMPLFVSSQPLTNHNHQYLSGYGSCNSNSLPRQVHNDVSLDSLPEWNPNEPTSQIRNGLAPSVTFNNFPARSRDFIRYVSAPSNGANSGSLLPLVMPNSKQPLMGNGSSDLVRNFKNSGLVPPNDVSKQNAGIQDGILGTEFDMSLLRVRHESVIKSLYSDLPRQCSSCGQRFRCQEEHRNHMDWHVRKNRMAKDTSKNPRKIPTLNNKSRKWFASTGLWLSAATGEQLDDQAVAELFDSEKETRKNDDEEFVVPADDDQKTCALCEEPFEDFFSDDADEWMYKGAVYLHKHDDNQGGTRTGINVSKLGPIVHAKCMPEKTRKSSTQDLRPQNLIPVSVPSARTLIC